MQHPQIVPMLLALHTAAWASPPASTPLTGESLYAPTDALVFVVDNVNDNKIYNSWETFFGVDGDDYGLTHGLDLSLQTRALGPDWMQWTLRGSTTLFTERLGFGGGDPSGRGNFGNQRFMNENRIELAWEHLPRDRAPLPWLYARAGLGWHQLDGQNEANFLSGSGQQRWIHDRLNEIRPLLAGINPHNLPTEGAVWHGAALTLTAGPTHHHSFGQGHWRWRNQALLHVDLSTLPGATAGGPRLSTDLYWQQRPHPAALAVHLGASLWVDLHVLDAETQWPDPLTLQPRDGLSAQLSPQFTFSMGNRAFTGGMRVVTVAGTPRNHARFNVRNRDSGVYDVLTAFIVRIGFPVKPWSKPKREAKKAAKTATAPSPQAIQRRCQAAPDATVSSSRS